jgi:hypothetical protein
MGNGAHWAVGHSVDRFRNALSAGRKLLPSRDPGLAEANRRPCGHMPSSRTLRALQGVRPQILRCLPPVAADPPAGSARTDITPKPRGNVGAVTPARDFHNFARSSHCRKRNDLGLLPQMRARKVSLCPAMSGFIEGSGPSGCDTGHTQATLSCYSFDASTHFLTPSSRLFFPATQHPNASHAGCTWGS